MNGEEREKGEQTYSDYYSQPRQLTFICFPNSYGNLLLSGGDR